MTPRIAWILPIAATLLLLGPQFGHAEGQGEPPAVEAEAERTHEEKPVAPPYVPVRREDLPTSPRRISVRGGHQSVQVNVNAQNQNIVGDAANEPSMAIDPTNPDSIVIGWRQFDTITNNFRQAGYAYSSDGGASWTFPGVLQPGQFRSDPVLAADNSGTFFYYSLSTTTTADMFISDDGGVSWFGPISALGGDKTWMTADTSGSAGDGHLYSIWNSSFTCCAEGTDFTRSTDGGATYGGPFTMPENPFWGTVDVGPAGEVYVVGASQDLDSHWVVRSTNASNAGVDPSFDLVSEVDLGGSVPFGGIPNPGGLQGQAWIAVDRSGGATEGNVYVLHSVDPPGPDPLDVMFARSIDGGQFWSAPVRVNDEPPPGGAWQWFGTMAVAPNGRIDVVWNDTRNDPSAENSELYYAYSTDAGVTWSASLAVSLSFSSLVGHPNQNKIGDYYHMISDVDGGALAYSATFNGEQDVYFLRVGDCNANGTHDSVDIAGETSDDCTENGIPDECEADCNGNSTADSCDIDGGASADCNTNQIPDDCEADCNGNAITDSCDIDGGPSGDCNTNNVPDECDLVFGGSEDCNSDALPDECDVALDLETSTGWNPFQLGDNATSGVWEWVDPNGTVAQPEDDHTPGGTNCFVTGQGPPGGGVAVADVDGGRTTLRSPLIDLTGFVDPTIGYWRWYSNDTGSFPNQDTFRVDVSNNGGTSWVTVETVGPAGLEASGGWFFHKFRVADLVTPTAQVQLRFVASDLGNGSNVEAAIDDVVVLDCVGCAAPVPAEVQNLRLGRSAPAVAALSWALAPAATSYDVYRGTAHDATDLSCYLTGLTGTTTEDDALLPAPGAVLFHVVVAVNCSGDGPLGSDRQPAVPCP